MDDSKLIASGTLPAGLGQKLVHDCLLCPSTKSDAQIAIRLTLLAPDKPLA